jgi:hypothetical protein
MESWQREDYGKASHVNESNEGLKKRRKRWHVTRFKSYVTHYGILRRGGIAPTHS